MKILTLVIFSLISITGLMASNQMSIHLGFPIVSQTTDINKNVIGYELNDSEKNKVGFFQRIRKSFQVWKQLVKKKIKKQWDKGHKLLGFLTFINLGMGLLSYLFFYILGKDIVILDSAFVGALILFLYLMAYMFFILSLVYAFIWAIYAVIKLIVGDDLNITKKDKKKIKKKKKVDILI